MQQLSRHWSGEAGVEARLERPGEDAEAGRRAKRVAEARGDAAGQERERQAMRGHMLRQVRPWASSGVEATDNRSLTLAAVPGGAMLEQTLVHFGGPTPTVAVNSASSSGAVGDVGAAARDASGAAHDSSVNARGEPSAEAGKDALWLRASLVSSLVDDTLVGGARLLQSSALKLRDITKSGRSWAFGICGVTFFLLIGGAIGWWELYGRKDEKVEEDDFDTKGALSSEEQSLADEDLVPVTMCEAEEEKESKGACQQQ